MPDLRTLFFGAVLPGLICGGLLYAFLALGRNRPRHVWLTASGLAIAVAYWVGQNAILQNGWWPVQSREWLGPLAVAIGAWCAIESSLPLGGAARWIARGAFALALGYVTVRLPLRNALRGDESVFGALAGRDGTLLIVQWLAVALLALAGWQIWSHIGTYLASRQSVLAALAVTFASSIAQLVSSSASGAQLHGALVAAFVASLVAALWRSERNFAPGFAGVIAFVQLGLLQDGTSGADLPMSSALLLYFAPAFLLVAHVMLPDTLPPATRWSVRIAALLVPLGVAVWIARALAPAPYMG